MILRRLLMNSVNEGGGGNGTTATPTPVPSSTPATITPAFRDTNTKTVKVDAGLKEMPSELKGKEFSLELDNPVIAESFGKRPIDAAQKVLDDNHKKDEKPLTDKPKLTTEEIKAKIADGGKVVKPAEAVVKPVTAAEKTDTTKPITAAKPNDGKPPSRDYTGYDEETVKAFKNMSDPAFQLMKKVVDERNNLVKTKQDHYLQHPDAYTLTTEYNDLNNRAFLASAERDFWKQQLINVRAGKDWYGLQGFDPKTGKPVLSAPQKPSDEVEIEIQNAMTQMTGLTQQLQQQGQQMVQSFKQRYEGDIAAINAEQAKQFGWVADPKGLEDKVHIGGELGDRTVKQIKDDLLGMLPQYRRGDVLAELSSNMYAGIRILQARIRELETQTAVAVEKKEEILRAEPSATITGSSDNGKKKGLVFDLEGMPQ